MSETMAIEDYLAKGGVLTSPENVPPRYRGELLRQMAIFIDSELAGAAGFADTLNAAPGIAERIAAARIVAEKLDHAGRVLSVMGRFGADVSLYERHHPWASRIGRNEDIGATRTGHDMRLSVFHYPLQGWTDAVVLNVLMGEAVGVQLDELQRISYQPLAEVFREIAPREKAHTELGVAGLKAILAPPEGRSEAATAIAYWQPRVAASFGRIASSRFEFLKRLGLRHRTNETLLADWSARIAETLRPLGLA